MTCTKGTYVRSLAHDLGQKIGCGAHLHTLRRVSSGKFEAAAAMQFEQVMNLSMAELEQRVVPVLKLVADIAASPKR